MRDALHFVDYQRAHWTSLRGLHLDHAPQVYGTESVRHTPMSELLWSESQAEWPFEEEPNLLPHLEYLYARSIGCVGILKDWLGKAYGVALRSKAKTLKLSHLKARALSVAQCRKILAEARAGEQKLVDDEVTGTKLAEELGMRFLEVGNHGDAPNLAKLKRRSLRPGQRKPTRDPVGIEQHAA